MNTKLITIVIQVLLLIFIGDDGNLVMFFKKSLPLEMRTEIEITLFGEKKSRYVEEQVFYSKHKIIK